MAAAGLAVLSKIYDRYEVLEADSVARIYQAMRKAAPRWHTSYCAKRQRYWPLDGSRTPMPGMMRDAYFRCGPGLYGPR